MRWHGKAKLSMSLNVLCGRQFPGARGRGVRGMKEGGRGYIYNLNGRSIMFFCRFGAEFAQFFHHLSNKFRYDDHWLTFLTKTIHFELKKRQFQLIFLIILPKNYLI